MRELLMHALHSDRVIILRAGKNKRSLPGAAGGEAGTCGRRRWWSWRVDATLLFSSFSILPSLRFFFFLLSVFLLRFLCLYLCPCSPCPVLPLFVRSLPQFVPVFLSCISLFLVQWLLKMELWSCYWRQSITVSPFVSLFCFFFQFFSPVSPLFSMFFFLSYLFPPPTQDEDDGDKCMRCCWLNGSSLLCVFSFSFLC